LSTFLAIRIVHVVGAVGDSQCPRAFVHSSERKVARYSRENKVGKPPGALFVAIIKRACAERGIVLDRSPAVAFAGAHNCTSRANAVDYQSPARCYMNEPDEPDANADEFKSLGPGTTHLHPLTPIVFAAAGIAVGVVTALVWGPALAVPLGLFGGGIGVWAVERGRRLR
jgi:hypothetical protein